MDKKVQDVVNQLTEKRLTKLEEIAMTTLIAVEKQALMVGVMAKMFLGAFGVLGLVVLYAVLNLIFKKPVMPVG